MILYSIFYKSKLAPPIIGGLLIIGMASLYFSVGVMQQVPAPYESALELLGLLLLFTLLPSYLFIGVVYSQRFSRRLALEIDEFDQVLEHAIVYPRPGYLLIGIAGGLFYANVFNVPQPFWQQLTLPTIQAILLGQNLVWLCIGFAIAIRLHTAWQFNQAGKLVPIDIYEQSALRPFSRNGLVDVLLAMGALSLTSLQSIDAEFRFENYMYALIVSIPAATTLGLLPMAAIHKRILAQRNTEFAAVNQFIQDSPRDLTTPNITSLELLLQRRERLLALNTWPIDVTTVTRFFLYLVIPPLAWLGAAFVEIAVDSVIGG